MQQQIEELKEVARREVFATPHDAAERLGLSYHFENELRETLQHMFDTYDDQNGHEDALISTGYFPLATFSLVGMGDVVTKEDFEWLFKRPKMLKPSEIICRYMDDVVSHKVTLVSVYSKE